MAFYDWWQAFQSLAFGLLSGLLKIMGCSRISFRGKDNISSLKLAEGPTLFRVSEGRMQPNGDGSVRRVWQNYVINVGPQATINNIRAQIANQDGGVQQQFQDRVSFAITCCWHPYKQHFAVASRVVTIDDECNDEIQLWDPSTDPANPICFSESTELFREDNSVQYQPALVLRFVRSEFLRRAVLLKLPDQFEQILRNYDTTVCVCYVYMSAVTRSSVTFLQWHFNHSRDMFWLSCVKVAFASGICTRLNSLCISICLCTRDVKNHRFPTERLNFSGDPTSSVEVAGAWMSFLRLPRCEVASKMEWSPCGSLLATSEQSGNCIRLWAADCLSSASVFHNGGTQIGKPSHQLPLVSTNLRRFTSGIEVQVLRWSPCGKRLFAAFDNKYVQIWETLTWTTEYAGLQAGSCTAAAWTPDGQALFVAFSPANGEDARCLVYYCPRNGLPHAPQRTDLSFQGRVIKKLQFDFMRDMSPDSFDNTLAVVWDPKATDDEPTETDPPLLFTVSMHPNRQQLVDTPVCFCSKPNNVGGAPAQTAIRNFGHSVLLTKVQNDYFLRFRR